MMSAPSSEPCKNVAAVVAVELIADSTAAVKRVVAESAADHVGAGAAVEMIVIVIAADGIVAALAVDFVATGAAEERVDPFVRAVDDVVAVFAVDPFAEPASGVEIVVAQRRRESNRCQSRS